MGVNVVVSGGGTIARIDDVRHVANVSTGRFSAMITEALLDQGANVWHIAAPGAQLPIDRLAHFDLTTREPKAEAARLIALRERWALARERLHIVPLGEGTVGEYAAQLEHVLKRHPIDIALLAMAASDYTPEPFAGKLASGEGDLEVRFRSAPKVIRSVRDWSPDLYLVGFKLLSRVSEQDLIREAEAACATNRADLTVANDLQTVRAGRHVVHLVRPGHPTETLGPGPNMARELVERVLTWSAERKR